LIGRPPEAPLSTDDKPVRVVDAFVDELDLLVEASGYRLVGEFRNRRGSAIAACASSAAQPMP
jgi:hypothetical protein